MNYDADIDSSFSAAMPEAAATPAPVPQHCDAARPFLHGLGPDRLSNSPSRPDGEWTVERNRPIEAGKLCRVAYAGEVVREFGCPRAFDRWLLRNHLHEAPESKQTPLSGYTVYEHRPDIPVPEDPLIDRPMCNVVTMADRAAEHLAHAGYEPDELVPACSKIFETDVGPREAQVWISQNVEESSIHLTGSYWSEGRNVLEPCFLNSSFSSDMTPREMYEQIDGFVEQAEDRIDKSFARSLLLSFES